VFQTVAARSNSSVASQATRVDKPPPVRVIAYYLPQYHPIPENDRWWGPGFTEWTNVTKCTSLFPGHHQPNLPADLGFYDLRVPETREQQARLASDFGLEGFCYWHYWFGNGRRILERPFMEVLRDGRPSLPFCLGWANESWAGHHHGLKNRLLIEQQYPGLSDYQDHYRALESAFLDNRYIKVCGKPLFVVYKPNDLPNPRQFTDCWRKLAIESGLPGLHLVGVGDSNWNPSHFGFDASILHEPWETLKLIPESLIDRVLMWLLKKDLAALTARVFGYPRVFDYSKFVESAFSNPIDYPNYPCVIPNWDTSPRLGTHAVVLQGANPELFAKLLRKGIEQVANREQEERLVFIKSWNEWAEGNFVEPDRRFGRAYLESIKSCIAQAADVVAVRNEPCRK